ncbi:hypothetical protein MTBBW1_1880015 [Desulfamplus magnetovallimortis]|uniref:Uncharacterized protein n=1 Tax=Desulfamplus magnetovallimortis TaxID=1246637 RepID=A0A1W1HB26_9BACT|nr:hypothetical protein MTBBW1_1880015 [Desulfamplus magnetovallimortis]
MAKYQESFDDCSAYRKWVDSMINQHPELFPDTISSGYSLHDKRVVSQIC